jgi:cell filamentation protein
VAARTAAGVRSCQSQGPRRQVSGSDDLYGYPGTRTLKNRLGISDSAKLDDAERYLVAQRVTEGIPEGSFDLAHLQAIPSPSVSGRLRLGRRNPHGRDQQGRTAVPVPPVHPHRHGGCSPQAGALAISRGFAKQAAVILGDVNFVHPFREGNGRTQLQYLKLLAAKAGHRLDLSRIDTKRWIEASKISHASDYDLMAQLIAGAIAE